MRDFELSDALDRSADAEQGAEPAQTRGAGQSEGTERHPQMSTFLNSDLEENLSSEMETSCCDMKDVKKEIFTINKDLDLMVCHNKRTMQSVANLVLVANWMSKNLKTDQLCSIIMDHVVEETIVKTDWNASTKTQKVIFKRVNSQGCCSLRDTAQKNLIQLSGEMKLQAITLKGGNGDHKVKFKMSRYAPPSVCHGDGHAVLLSITDNLHISCSKTDDGVVLNLEECSKEQLKDITKGEDMDRFLFFSRTTGVSVTTFESVKYCGWFISTSSVETNPSVDMCKEGATHRVTTFKVI